MIQIEVTDAGLIEYGACLEEQRKRFDAIISAKAAGDAQTARALQCIILCEHPHVYTLGKSGSQDNLLIGEDLLEKIGAKYFRTDRGGDITYHGPGQLVGYPILDLEAKELGLKEYIDRLEEAIIRTVARYGITGRRREGATGVWLDATEGKPLRKISAIGVRSSKFVTMHGFALNVTPQMEYFGYINPCGFTDGAVTSIAMEIPQAPTMATVKQDFLSEFSEIFGLTPTGRTT